MAAKAGGTGARKTTKSQQLVAEDRSELFGLEPSTQCIQCRYSKCACIVAIDESPHKYNEFVPFMLLLDSMERTYLLFQLLLKSS